MPRFFGVGRGPIAEYEEPLEPNVPDPSPPPPPELIGHIPQVESTFGYWEAASGIGNDEGVMIAESTCSAVFGAKLRGSAGGKALLGYMELTRIALERCASAYDAICLMGSLAMEYGFAGNTCDLAGSAESLTVVDGKEAWVMHILPDDTGESAIWAAQRLEEGHAAVVPNLFVIRRIDSDADGFLLSSNAKEIATRCLGWSGGDFDFAAIFSKGEPGQKYYCGRRQWRALSLFAPSLQLEPEYTDAINDAPYPFSVLPDEPLTRHDFCRIMRDTYEGTVYSLGDDQPAAGPFGWTDRYDSFAYPKRGGGEDGSVEEVIPLFERPIGVHRMPYSYICEPSDEPSKRPPLFHFGAHNSLTSVYLPVLCASNTCPPSLSTGSMKALDRACAYWTFRIVKHTAKGLVWNRCLEFLRERQQRWEAEVDAVIDQSVRAGDQLEATSMALSRLAEDVLTDWYGLQDEMLLRFGDGWEYDWASDGPVHPPEAEEGQEHAGESKCKPVRYPVEWLEKVSAWQPVEPTGGA